MSKSEIAMDEFAPKLAPRDSSVRKLIPQLITGVGVAVVCLMYGISNGWSSPYLAKLTAPNSPLPLTLQQASWVASLINLGKFSGGIVGSVSTTYLGSKKAMLVVLVLMSICWIMTFLATAPWYLYVARFSSGSSLGVLICTYPVYLGEVSLPSVRGLMIGLAGFGSALGVVFGTIFGSLLEMGTSALIYLGICVLVTILFIWLPESPHHLVKINQQERAKESIRWYRADYGVEEEFSSIKRFVASARALSFAEKMKGLNSPAVKRALMLTLTILILMQTCGYNIVLPYLELILRNGKFDLVDPPVATMYINFVSLAAAIFPIVGFDRFGRRFLLILSSMGCALGLLGTGIHFALLERGSSIDTQLLLVLSVGIFKILFFMGLITVPYALTGELFPAQIKYFAAFIVTTIGSFFGFLDTKSYQSLIEIIGQSNVFFLHALITFSTVPFTLIFLPETKGKTLEQIQNDLVKA